MIRFLLLAMFVVGAVVLARQVLGARARPATGPAAPIGGLEADQQTLRALRDAGADLTKATEVNFYLYLPTEAAARQAAAQAATPELRATVSRAAQGPTWLCLVSGEMVPTESAVHAASTRLQAVAAAHGGEYDGWEAAVAR